MFRLAGELALRNRAVLVTTTTHLSLGQAGSGDRHVTLYKNDERPVSLAAENLQGITVVTGPQMPDGRVSGLGPGLLTYLDALAGQAEIPILIESDGSRMLPLKAPAAHEPVVPDMADTVVVSAGFSALGKPLTPEFVHRPENFARLSGLAMNQVIGGQDIVNVMGHPQGGLKGIPPGARRVALLNQADTALLQSAAGRMTAGLLPSFDSVLIAALGSGAGEVFARYEQIGAVVLAAGGSRRLGSPKQLLNWRGKRLVTHVAEQALAAGCSPVVVVTGASGEAVAEALSGLPVRIVHNADWETGQSSSVKAGLAALPAGAGGAVFLLVDQPFVDAPLIRAVIDAHARSGGPITAPLVDERRGNPVLFDRDTFPDFAGLEGDVGGRPLFARYPVTWVPWHDPGPLLDIDTVSDYEALGGSDLL